MCPVGAQPGSHVLVRHTDFRLEPKDKVLGVAIHGLHTAHPLKTLPKIETAVEDQITDKRMKVVYDEEAHSAQVHEAESGKLLPSAIADWFGWATYYRDTMVCGNRIPTRPSRLVVEGLHIEDSY